MTAVSPTAPSSTTQQLVQLGLIGDNIAMSRTPRLQECAGRLIGLEVRYDRLVPRERGQSFDEIFVDAQARGFRGLNITYPYKERVLQHVTVPDRKMAALGAVNTVVFGPDGPTGYNTDWSGFIAGYRHAIGPVDPGPVCMVGAGGVGKAVAFGLLELGMHDLRIVERDLVKAEALAAALRNADPSVEVRVTGNVTEGSAGASGLVNCTPVGMVGYEGTPIPRELMSAAGWAFDAVYTPVDTTFLKDAAANGLKVMSGEELFFYQGLHAFSFFHEQDLDEAALRRLVEKEGI